jgi:hypothetical protein
MTDIAWLPNHDYLAGAVVTETAGLPLWRCTVAGQTGGTEPTWATAAPWTTTDGSVTWTLNTTFRERVRAGMATTLGLFKIANPTLLRKVWSVRPDSYTLGDLPCIAIGDLTETIGDGAGPFQGIRQRKMTGFTVSIVDRTPDNTEAANRSDILVDALMDYLTDAYHMAGGTSLVTPLGVEDGPSGSVSEAPNLSWYSQVLIFEATIAEGRT